MNLIEEEILGLASVFNPFVTHISASRIGMMAHSLSQFQLPVNGESPNIFTGYENLAEDYEHSQAKLEDDVEVLAIIPKFVFTKVSEHLKPHIPEYYLICRNHSDSTLDYHTIKKFHKLNEEFGYETSIIDNSILNSETIPKGTKLYKAKMFNEDGTFKYGANANIVFTTLPHTIEDAFLISDELADKLNPDGFKTISMAILPDKEFIINSYGNDDTHLAIPELGSCVASDGILLRARDKEKISAMTDFNSVNINKTNRILDTIYYVEKHAKVVDIDVYCSPLVLKDITGYLDQFVFYHDAKLVAYEQIFDIYEKFKDRYICTKKFNTFITDIIKYLHLHKRKQNKIKLPRKKTLLLNKDEQIQCLVNITVQYRKPLNKGNKITGRDGGKGVISMILPKDQMPRDDAGIVADIAIDPVSIISRNNVAQLMESYINRLSKLNIDKVSNAKDIDNSFNYIIKYIETISPDYSDKIKQACTSIMLKRDFLMYSTMHGLKLQIQASQGNINSELIKTLYKNYDAKISPMTFTITNELGDTKTIRTNDSICIGNKFIYLLYNSPEISAINIGPVNAFYLPAKLYRNKHVFFPIRENTTKVFDEDATRVILDTLGPEITYRLRGLSTSSKGIEKSALAILEADLPSNIDIVDITNKELGNTDTMISVIHTITNSFGLDLQNVKLNESDIEYYHKAMLACLEEDTIES